MEEELRKGSQLNLSSWFHSTRLVSINASGMIRRSTSTFGYSDVNPIIVRRRHPGPWNRCKLQLIPWFTRLELVYSVLRTPDHDNTSEVSIIMVAIAIAPEPWHYGTASRKWSVVVQVLRTQNVIQPSELKVFGNGWPSSLLFEERHQPSRGRLCCLDILVIHSLHDRLSGRQTKSSLSSYDAQPKLVLRTLQLFTETYASR
jgi:hypothetical protein